MPATTTTSIAPPPPPPPPDAGGGIGAVERVAPAPEEDTEAEPAEEVGEEEDEDEPEGRKKKEKKASRKTRADKWGVWAVALLIEMRAEPDTLRKFRTETDANRAHAVKRLWEDLAVRFQAAIRDRGGEEFGTAEYKAADLKVWLC